MIMTWKRSYLIFLCLFYTPFSFLQAWADPQWVRAGDESTSNTWINCLAFDAQGTIFAGTKDKGVMRLPKDANYWINSSNGLESLKISCLAVLPNGSILAGTGDGGPSFSSYGGTGLYRSTDTGSSWKSVNLGIQAPSDVKSIAIHFNNSIYMSQLSANQQPTIYYSTDDGNHWTPISDWPGGWEFAMAMMPLESGQILCGFVDAGMYSAIDLYPRRTGDPSYRFEPSGMLSPWISSFCTNPLTGDIFAGTYGSSGVKIFKSTDQARSWQAINFKFYDVNDTGIYDIGCISRIREMA